MTATDLARKLPFWERLDDSEKQAVSSAAALRQYGRDAVLHGGDSSCLGLLYIISGGVRVYIVSEEGREITLFRAAAGDTCVLSASCVISQIQFETLMVTESPTDVLILNSGVFSKLTENNIYVRCFAYELAAERFSAAMRVFQSLLFESFDRRLAGFLLERTAQAGSDELRMTQEQIASEINSAREVVTRKLRQFADEGMIGLRRGVITVKDADALRRML